MRRGFYTQLAWTGMRKNERLYIPFIAASIVMVVVFYIISFLSNAPMLDEISNGNVLKSIINVGKAIIGAFSFGFIFYSSTFLMKRRAKEFGLYNILGMDKRNLAQVLAMEILIAVAGSLVFGLVLGIAFSKLAEMCLCRFIGIVTTFSFGISWISVLESVVLFVGTYLFVFLNNIRKIRMSKPAELIKDEDAGDKPPKSNWAVGIGGLLVLVAAYVISVKIQQPVAEMKSFILACVLAMLGTVCLFVSGSVLFCKMLERRKNYYYRPEHFVSLSSMVYRMKRNGAGLAEICILATMVLVMITSTACLYFGVEQSLRTRYPYDAVINVQFNDYSEVNDNTVRKLYSTVANIVNSYGLLCENDVEFTSSNIGAYLVDGVLKESRDVNSDIIYDANDLYQVTFVTVDEYNRERHANLKLRPNQVFISTSEVSYKYDHMTMLDGTDYDLLGYVANMREFVDGTSLVVPTLVVVTNKLEKSWAPVPTWCYAFNLDCNDSMQIELIRQLNHALDETCSKLGLKFSATGLAANRMSFYASYGGIFFVGILLSIIFLFETVLIIYYKQITEGYEDQKKFEIMQKLGLTRDAIRMSINEQLRTIFYLPLIMAVIHMCFAIPVISKLLLSFSISSTRLIICTAGVTIAIFAGFYTLVYRLTSNAYYKIVSK